MKAAETRIPREPWPGRHGCLASYFLAIFLGSSAISVAQINSWTKPTSGNWEEMQWSRGVLPGPGQAIMITNAGWKAVAIAASTAQNHPQSLTVHSFTVASPVDSFNTLLLNFFGLGVPLTSRFVTVASNSALTMHLSALHLSGGPGEGMSIGGVVTQNDSARLTGSQFDVGWIGAGVYNLNSGSVDVDNAWVGGPHGGVFNQNGGSFTTDILHLEHAGRYNLRGGELNAELYTGDGTVFRHEDGVTRSRLTFFGGDYIFTGGMNQGGISVPVPGGFSDDNGNARAIQSGGTNAGPVSVGGGGTGVYTLSNGVVESPIIQVGRFGWFHQVAGVVTTPATLVVAGGEFDRGGIAHGFYTLTGGRLSSPGIDMNAATFAQHGGTNAVTGDVQIGPGTRQGAITSYVLTEGLLTAENTAVMWSPSGGFIQEGGKHVVAGQLTISGDALDATHRRWRGYVLSGGELVISNMVIYPVGIFEHTGGTFAQTGNLILMGGHLHPASASEPFGPLRLQSNGGFTNSILRVPTNASIVRFGASQAMAWSGDARLTIDNWKGSHLGGGADQIIFGNSAAALTAPQLRQIYFRDPGGLSPGLHPTRILPSGEIVPDSVPPTGRPPPRLTLRPQPGAFEITVTGETNANYGIHRSFDVINWELWAIGTATNGTLTVVDPDTWPFYRFYRAVLMR